MRTSLLLAFFMLVFGCAKEPEPPKKPLRYGVESQRASPYVVTIWNTAPAVTVGSNAFKLQFQTPEKQPADPGAFQIEPILVESGKTPLKGDAHIKPTEETGVYDIAAELPAAGRWRFNVAFGSHNLAFYYIARQEADESNRSH